LTAESSAERSYTPSASTAITRPITPAAAPAASGAEPEAVVASRTGVLTRPRLDPYWLAILLFAAYAALSISRYRRMATMSWDLGIFEQAVRAYAHLQAPIVGIKGPGVNILGDHFSPITALIAPFYRVFPTAITLLTAQAALFALSAVPVTRAAAQLLGRRRGLAIGIAYGMSWGVQRAVDFDFHEICFAVPLIAFALEAVLRERWRSALLWAATLVLVKEDLGLTTAAIGLIVLLRARRTEPRAVPPAVGMIVFGLVACAITFTVVIPAFNTGGSYGYWNKLGESGGSPLSSLFAASDQKLRTLLWILLPTSGLLALRSPLVLAALPTLAWRFVSSDDHYWGTDWHYNATLMPIAFLALTDAIPRATGRLRSYAEHLPAAALAAAVALSTTLPLADLTHTATYRPGPRAAAAARVLGRIPDGATVEGNVGTIAHLTNRTQVFWVGDTPGITPPSYIALDQLNISQSALLAYAKQLHPQATYTMLAAEDGYWVMMLDVKSTT
jgi:uncharacterized membrane protein